ncbi:MAG: hypothetical protein ACJASB_004016 [Shewanella psychromarinicola]|jgi:hypothetical protein
MIGMTHFKVNWDKTRSVTSIAGALYDRHKKTAIAVL